MSNSQCLLRTLAFGLLVFVAQPQLLAHAAPLAHQKSASSTSDSEPDADADQVTQSKLVSPLQSLVGKSVTDSSGDQGKIVDFVVTRGGQYQTPGILSDVAVQFAQINGGATFLVPSSYLAPPPQPLSLTITTSKLKGLPVLTNNTLPSKITSSHPQATLATTLMGAKVTSSNGQALGKVSDIELNMAHKTVDYFAVSQSSGLPNAIYAVPAGDTAKFASGTLPLSITAKQFAQLKGFASGNLPAVSGLTHYSFAPQGLYPSTSHAALMSALVLSMHEEANANLSYRAFAKVARSNGDPLAADFWNTVAKVELNDHFHSDAAMAGKIQDTLQNLKTSVSTEQKTISTYRMYEQNAQQAGYSSIASTYHSLIQLEQGQLNALQSALSDVQGGQQPTSSSLTGMLPQAPTVQTTPGKPQAEGQTETQLKEASKVAAYEFALYGMYSRLAASQAYPYVSDLFHDLSKDESKHAAPTLSNLAGAVSANVVENLARSVGAEFNAHNRYVSQSQLAQGAGDQTIARQLYFNGYMEEHHGEGFQALLNSMGND